VVHSKLWWCLR